MEADKPRMTLDGYYHWISVNGERYEMDVIIHRDGSVTERFEELSIPYKYGFHIPLSEAELDFLKQEKPKKVIIGCGYKGMMDLTLGAKEFMKSFDYVAKTTQDAIQIINEGKEQDFVAIMHVKC
ncbi:MAG: hypothetical protein A4E29_00424 [Methanomassiliicoccales archaeon PtaB.Bin134]|nr:MAG: hypothetical protein A4E29_00424 [Methanomassiliicoccales archaeon PtaB.Bin134]